MTTNQQALYYLLEEQGYSHGLCVSTLRILSQSKIAVNHAIIFIEDNHPTESEFIEYLVDMCTVE